MNIRNFAMGGGFFIAGTTMALVFFILHTPPALSYERRALPHVTLRTVNIAQVPILKATEANLAAAPLADMSILINLTSFLKSFDTYLASAKMQAPVHDVQAQINALQRQISQTSQINNLSNITLSSPTISAPSITGLTTSQVSEGSNTYYTDARVAGYINASSTIPNAIGSAFGDVLFWNGSRWAPLATSSLGISGGSGGSGTVTSVAAGNGLLGGTFTTSGTISLDYASSSIWTAASSTYTGHLSLNNASTSLFTHTGDTWFTSITNALLGTDSNGKLVATSSIGTNLLTGILSIVNGGTNATSQTTNGVNYFDGTRITSGTSLTFNGTTFGTPLFSATQTTGTSTIAAGQGFTIGGSQFVVQQGSGYVGIGTTSPSSALSVYGFVNVDGTTGGYKQAGNTILYASTTNASLAVGASSAAAWLSASSTSWQSVAVGSGAMATAPTSGAATRNTAVGYQALDVNTTGADNNAFGATALGANTTGSGNNAFGRTALSVNTTGSNNMAMGTNALASNTTGSNSVGIGASVLQLNASATSTVAIGANAGKGASAYSNQGGVYVGMFAGSALATGSDYNTLIGFQSGGGITTGARNVLLGQSTLAASQSQVTTGSNNIAIGNDVAIASSTLSNQLNIGNFIYGTGLSGTGATLSNALIGFGSTTPWARLSIAGAAGSTAPLFAISSTTSGFATSSVFYINSNGLVGIATSSPWRTLSITGTAAINGLTEFAAGDSAVCQRAGGEITVDAGVSSCIVSSMYVKHNILNVPTDDAMTRIMALNPVSFVYNDSGTDDLGLIAERVASVDPRYAQYTTQEKEVDGHHYNVGDPTAINWSAITADLIKVVQNSLSRQSAQDARISALEARLGSSAPSASPSPSVSTTATTAPEISISGDNPALIHVGDSYVDLGASIIGPQQDLNLGILTYLNGRFVSQIQLDTSTTSNHMIDYVVAGSSGLTSTSTRTVIVE